MLRTIRADTALIHSGFHSGVILGLSEGVSQLQSGKKESFLTFFSEDTETQREGCGVCLKPASEAVHPAKGGADIWSGGFGFLVFVKVISNFRWAVTDFQLLISPVWQPENIAMGILYTNTRIWNETSGIGEHILCF